MNTRLRFVKCFAFSDLPTGWSVARAAADWGGNPLLLIDEGKPPYPKDDPSIEARRNWAYARPTAQHVIYWEGSSQRSVSLDKACLRLTNHVQLFGDGWLVAAGRGGRGDVCDRDGQILRTMDLGDASEDVQTTPRGHIWVSYFDEGVFGGGIGQHGLVCFDDRGDPVFKYSEFAEQNKLPFVCDCYAMNVVGDDEVWLSYYTDFPLVSIKNFQLHRAWKDFSCMGKAFAFHGDTVIFPKCYTRMEGRSQLLVRALSDSSEAEAAEAVDESDSIIGGHFSAIGRGPHFYLLTDSALYRLQL